MTLKTLFVELSLLYSKLEYYVTGFSHLWDTKQGNLYRAVALENSGAAHVYVRVAFILSTKTRNITFLVKSRENVIVVETMNRF